MGPEEFATIPPRHPLRPLEAPFAIIRVLEIIRTVSTFLPQLWAESIGLSASFALMHVLIGDEACGLIDRRRWKLIV